METIGKMPGLSHLVAPGLADTFLGQGALLLETVRDLLESMSSWTG